MFKSLHPACWALLQICLCAYTEVELGTEQVLSQSCLYLLCSEQGIFITTSFMTWCGGSKNHITLSCTHVSMNSLNQHLCWGKLLFGKWGASSRCVCLCVFPAESLHGLKYLSKYSSLTLAVLFSWGEQWVQITTSWDTVPTLCCAVDSFSRRALVYICNGTTFLKGETEFKLG